MFSSRDPGSLPVLVLQSVTPLPDLVFRVK